MPISRGEGAPVLPSINANLLVALDALLRTSSVSRAASTMGVSQSTMSGTLAQLRDLFSDPLLVRQGRSMVPTPLARAVGLELRRGADAFETVLSRRGGFDPKTSRQEFVVALNDRSEEALLPALIARVRRHAPGVSLQALPWGLFEPPAGLLDGTVDLVIGIAEHADGEREPTVPAGAGRSLRMSALFDSELTTIARTGHPKVGRRLTLDTFCEVEHVLGTEQPRGRGVVDRALDSLGRERRIAVRVHRHSLVARIVAETDLIATIGKRPAAHAAKRYGLRCFKPPVEVRRASFTMMWSASTDQDPARRWLREQVGAAAERLG